RPAVPRQEGDPGVVRAEEPRGRLGARPGEHRHIPRLEPRHQPGERALRGEPPVGRLALRLPQRGHLAAPLPVAGEPQLLLDQLVHPLLDQHLRQHELLLRALPERQRGAFREGHQLAAGEGVLVALHPLHHVLVVLLPRGEGVPAPAAAAGLLPAQHPSQGSTWTTTSRRPNSRRSAASTASAISCPRVTDAAPSTLIVSSAKLWTPARRLRLP